jgi:hypothetical protein
MVTTVLGYVWRLDTICSDVVLGNDRVAACQPVILIDKSTIGNLLSLLSHLSQPRCWYRVPGLSPSDPTMLPLANQPSSPCGSLRDSSARDALSSFLYECYNNDMFCLDLFNDHAIPPPSVTCVTISGMPYSPPHLLSHLCSSSWKMYFKYTK